MKINDQRTIAYFQWSTIRSAADLHVPMIAVTLLYRKGYFYQRLDETGRQREEPVHIFDNRLILCLKLGETK